ncbi:MAG: NAD-dependent epimerase/dehydratase family protein [Bacteroidia bacterium]|nr:NAD-dependent epimerase/dehydratase family protein [Bacteroidia bacterium]
MIAITGATGLLGGFIASRFISAGEKVVGLTRKRITVDDSHEQPENITWREVNLLDPISISESLKDVHTVIHSAALVSFNPRKTKEIFETNTEGTKNIVDACLAVGVKKLIHISSVSALGRQKGIYRINEESHWTNKTLTSDYALSKYQAEVEVYRGHEEGLEVSIVNPSVILAPSDWSSSSSQLFKYIWNENSFYTDGFLNYVDARDVANMVYVLSKSNFNGERFIASTNLISFKNIFDEIAKRFNKKPPSIRINTPFSEVLAFLENIRCTLTNQEPVITKHTVQMAAEPFYYDNKKAVEKLNLSFHTLAETLDFCCPYYLQKITTNK